MERTLSDYEKIKKAEEIYNRRKMREVGGVRVSNPRVERTPKKEYNSVKKMVLQICICIVLYFIVYLVQNSNYIFSEDFMNKTREILSYDINFNKYISQMTENFQKNNWFGIFAPKEENKQNEENAEQNDVQEQGATEAEEQNKENEQVETSESITPEVGAVGGSEPENIISEVAIAGVTTQEESPKSQMEIDADTIKTNYSLCAPLRGEITSPYGERSIAPKFHVGVDIGANTGTSIVSAMDGVATLVSTTGDYGNHIKITSGDLSTLYAHCSKLDVVEGQEIKKGDKIGEVGATGNATGPHLHFEIILERTIC